jgi:hypothetical protein
MSADVVKDGYIAILLRNTQWRAAVHNSESVAFRRKVGDVAKSLIRHADSQKKGCCGA